MSVAILMPAYNEATRLLGTLASIRDLAESIGGVTLFLVDDGSRPPVDAKLLPPRTASFRIVLARHPVNLGQGAALETARQLALRDGTSRIFLTMDSDGQHRAVDARAIVRAVAAGADVAFGNRFLGDSDVPPTRRLLLQAARVFERVLTGLRLSDAHNGLRGFSLRAIERVPIRQNRMAHATEIKQRVSREPGLTLVEVPVKVHYSRVTSEKGQSTAGAAIIVRDLIGEYLFGGTR